MDVVRHRYNAVHMIFDSMIVQAVFKNQTPHPVWQNPTIMSDKGDEEGLAFCLEMREIAAIFTLGGLGRRNGSW